MGNTFKRTRVASVSTLAFTLTSALLLILTLAHTNSTFAQGQENYENSSLVGRILYIEGKLLRYVPEDEDWIETDQDMPFGEYDMLYCPDDAKAETILPNNTLIRIGSDTQVQLVQLNAEVTEVDVSSGAVRLYNNSTSTEIKATTPFGDVVMPPETRCDLYVHENQAELLSLKGSVLFLRSGGSERHEVMAGSSGIIATADRVSASAHQSSREWDAWNRDRDQRWAQRMNGRGSSADHLPESLQGEAYDLERNGRWERVYYEGDYRYFWRPAYVSVGWTPFSCGRWVVWHGEHTWVPYESFGYVTHHYGNWVYAGEHWYWAPPVSRVSVRTHFPHLSIGVSWYPGRVAWLHSGVSIGWVPLAPYETYYSCRYWGPRSRVRYYNNYLEYNRYKYRNYWHARFIDHDRFYRTKNYHQAGLRKLRKNENVRRSALVPEKVRNLHRKANHDRYVSRQPDFKNTLAKIDNRRKKTHALKRNDRVKDHRVSDKIYKENSQKLKQGKVNLIRKNEKSVQNSKPVRKKSETVLERIQRENRDGKEKKSKIVRTNVTENKIKVKKTENPGKKITAKRNSGRIWNLNKPGKAYEESKKMTVRKSKTYQLKANKSRETRQTVVKSDRSFSRNSSVLKENNRKRDTAVSKSNRKSISRSFTNPFANTMKSSSRKVVTERSGNSVKRNSFSSGSKMFGSSRSGKSAGRAWGMHNNGRSGR